jgi:hypothetical protein
MEHDYPAAHSMDAYWFAIDERGAVADFETGEPGPAPVDASHDIFEALYTLYFGPYDYDASDGWEPEEWAEQLGVTFYRYPGDYDWLILPFVRTVTPVQPLHVDQLPPDLRNQCGDMRFFMLRFDEKETLQPLEFCPDPVEYYDCVDYELRPAYLVGDGVTVRPVRGDEKKFADFVSQYRQQHPKHARNLRFEGPTE